MPLNYVVQGPLHFLGPFFIPIVSSRLVLRGIERCQCADKIWSCLRYGRGHFEQLASCKNKNYDYCSWERISSIVSVCQLRFKEAM